MREITYGDYSGTIKAETMLTKPEKEVIVTIRPRKNRWKRNLQQIFVHGTVATAGAIFIAGFAIFNIPMIAIGMGWVLTVGICNIIDELRR